MRTEKEGSDHGGRRVHKSRNTRGLKKEQVLNFQHVLRMGRMGAGGLGGGGKRRSKGGDWLRLSFFQYIREKRR